MYIYVFMYVRYTFRQFKQWGCQTLYRGDGRILQGAGYTQLKMKAVATVDCGSIMCCDIDAIRHRHG